MEYYYLIGCQSLWLSCWWWQNSFHIFRLLRMCWDSAKTCLKWTLEEVFKTLFCQMVQLFWKSRSGWRQSLIIFHMTRRQSSFWIRNKSGVRTHLNPIAGFRVRSRRFRTSQIWNHNVFRFVTTRDILRQMQASCIAILNFPARHVAS